MSQTALFDERFNVQKREDPTAPPTFPAVPPSTIPSTPIDTGILEDIVLPPHEEQPQIVYSKGNVTLSGLHMSVHCPTEERLTSQIEGLTPVLLTQIAADLEDWFVVVDEKHKEKSTRGRGWQGRGKKISEQSRVRLIRFSPFPSSFSNVLRTIRRDIYEDLHEYCLVLEGEVHGGYKQNIYILPYANAPAFMGKLQARNKIIDDLNTKIASFLTSKEYMDIVDILKRFNQERVLERVTWHLEHISFDATPLALEPAAVKQMVEGEYAKMFRKLSDDEQRGLQALEHELEQKRQELVVKGVENLRKRIENLARRIVAASKKDPSKVREELQRLRGLATSVGLEAIATGVIDPLAQVVDDPDKVMATFGTNDISSVVNNRIKSLIESL